MSNKIKIAVSGVGNRSLPKDSQKTNWYGWVELIRRSERFELVGAHDVSEDSLKRIQNEGYLTQSQTFTDLESLIKGASPEVLLVTNPAQYHASTIKWALENDLHCLVEKPLVDDLISGEELIALAEQKKRVVSVIQNWRTKDVGQILKKSISDGLIGDVGHVFFRYIRDRENPNYPSYIFKEKFPLLYAMGIHHLDLIRYILQDEFKSVHGQSFKPPWSMYQSDTGLNLFFKTKKNVAVIYTGTISSKNKGISQESLVIEGEKGTLVNDSAWMEPPLWFYPRGSQERVDLTQDVKDASTRGQYDISDQNILDDFYQSIKNGSQPICSAADALKSIAVLEASKLSCETGKEINMDEILSVSQL